MNFGYPEMMYQFNKIRFSGSLVEQLNQIDINELIINPERYIDKFGNFNESLINKTSKKYSSSEFGIIGDDEFLKRMVFPLNEVDSNPSGYQSDVNVLDGPDEISTRLWWDTGGSNF